MLFLRSATILSLFWNNSAPITIAYILHTRECVCVRASDKH